MDKFIDKINENKVLFWSVFAVIILVGLVLRLTIINYPLWYDEGCSIATAINSFPAGINDYLWNHDLQHTPFYFYILHFIMQWFGDSEVVLRGSSLIVAMMLLPLTYIVTEKLSSKKVALLAMMLMSVNTFQILYSIEIRMYPYVMLLALLSINYLIDYDRKGDFASLVKLNIVNILNPYFLTGAIVWNIVQFIFYTSYMDVKKADSEKIKKYVLSNVVSALFMIPYVVIIAHYAVVRSTFLVTDLSMFEMTNLWGLIQNLFSADPGHIHETRHEDYVMVWQTVFLVFWPIVYMFIGLFNCLRDKEKFVHFLLGMVALSFGIFLFLANSRMIAFTGRYLIFIAPFVFILTAIGLSKLNKYHLAGFMVFYTLACGYSLWQSSLPHSQDPFFVMPNGQKRPIFNHYKDIAEFSLKSPADFAKKNGLGKNDLVVMPFASSVSFYYFKGDNMPHVMPLELFHEVRNPDSTIIYDKNQSEAFKSADKTEVFRKIITGNKFISNNLVKFMQNQFDMVPRGGYILWVVYYSDNYAIKPENEVKQIYSNYDIVKNNAMTGMLSKFDIDLIKLVLSQADLVKRDRDDSNQYFLFRKR